MSDDPIETANNAIVPCKKLSSKINCLDSAEELIRKTISPNATIITFSNYEPEMPIDNVILEIDGHLIAI